jgi:hypothetical protein
MSTQQDNLEVGAEFDWLVEADKEVLQSAVAVADLRAERTPLSDVGLREAASRQGHLLLGRIDDDLFHCFAVYMIGLWLRAAYSVRLPAPETNARDGNEV